MSSTDANPTEPLNGFWVKSPIIGSKNDFSGHSSNPEHCVAIGIDFGTSNCCAAIWLQEENRVKIIRDIPTGGYI